MEEKIFLRVPYDIVKLSSLAKAIKVSLSVGQTGRLNLRQKYKNCVMFDLWFLFVPSANRLA